MAAKTTKADAAATAKALAAADDKKVETKAAPAKKVEEKKPAAEKKAAPAKKTEEKKAAPAKKAPAKKATTTKKEVEKSALIQDNYGNGKTFDQITTDAMNDFKANNKKVAITKVEVYIKAIENKVYYVINGTERGEMDLF